MRAPLSGRHALVTGGSRGIGRAVAAALTGAGATVTVLGRTESALRSAVASGAAAEFVTADVTDDVQCRSAIAAASAKQGPIDILVANAGAAESAPFARSDDQLFRRMIDVNLMGVVHAARAVMTGMVERGFGRVVAVASVAGLKGYAYVSAYCAAKHAAVGLVRALAVECAGTGVTVNAVCPGYADTDLVRESLDRIVTKTGKSREAALAALLAPDAQDRLIAPAEIAAAVLDLCVPGTDRVTGEAVLVHSRIEAGA
jgi:NAD(P)-dependent dehydrogenase (short-subunit alcohol dehydrogenase family)